MEIESIRHKALRAFVEGGRGAGLDARQLPKIANIIAFLDAMADVSELRVPPNWGAHQLTGDRAGTWSLTITRNYRLTFIVSNRGTITDMDLEDYH